MKYLRSAASGAFVAIYLGASMSVVEARCHSLRCDVVRGTKVTVRDAGPAIARPGEQFVKFVKDPTKGLRDSANKVVDNAEQKTKQIITDAGKAADNLVEKAGNTGSELLKQGAIWLSIGLGSIMAVMIFISIMLATLVFRRTLPQPRDAAHA